MSFVKFLASLCYVDTIPYICDVQNAPFEFNISPCHIFKTLVFNLTITGFRSTITYVFNVRQSNGWASSAMLISKFHTMRASVSCISA